MISYDEIRGLGPRIFGEEWVADFAGCCWFLGSVVRLGAGWSWLCGAVTRRLVLTPWCGWALVLALWCG